MLNPIALSENKTVIIDQSYSSHADVICEKYNLAGKKVKILKLKTVNAEDTYVTDGNEPTYVRTVGATELELDTGEVINIEEFKDDYYWAFFTDQTPELFIEVNNV